MSNTNTLSDIEKQQLIIEFTQKANEYVKELAGDGGRALPSIDEHHQVGTVHLWGVVAPADGTCKFVDFSLDIEHEWSDEDEFVDSFDHNDTAAKLISDSILAITLTLGGMAFSSATTPERMAYGLIEDGSTCGRRFVADYPAQPTEDVQTE